MKKINDIAFRTLIQGGLSFRSQIENHIQRNDPSLVDAIPPHLKWLKDNGIFAAMEEEEKEWFELDAGSWDESLIQECFWKIESFKALLWVTKVYSEMPAFYEVGDVNEIYKKALYPDDPSSFLESSGIQETDVLKKELEVYEFLHWRCRTELLRLQGMVPPEGDTFEGTVQRAITSIPTGSTVIEHDSEDLILSGVKFLDFEDKGTVMSTCVERHLALSWVIGNESWNETRTDT